VLDWQSPHVAERSYSGTLDVAEEGMAETQVAGARHDTE
jgi:hypothetical protein